MKLRPTRSIRKPRLTRFSQKLLAEWQRLQLPLRDAGAVVAVSGGADSTALLLALNELLTAQKLELKLVVAHLDHGLRKGQSRKDAKWVGQLAKELGNRFATERANVKLRANNKGENLEQAARRARYKFLTRVARVENSQIVLVAHTMDDQAETMMLNLLRGSGIDGLAGIEPVRRLDERRQILLARPLLCWARRADTEEYCLDRNTSPRADEMNSDEAYSRVRVRRQLVPLMETFNGRVVEALSRTAKLLREDSANLASGAKDLLKQAREEAGAATSVGTALKKHAKNKVTGLCVEVLTTASPALRRRALRAWIEQERGDLRRLELVHLLAVENLLSNGRGGRVVELPGGARITRKRGLLEFIGAKRASVGGGRRKRLGKTVERPPRGAKNAS